MLRLFVRQKDGSETGSISSGVDRIDDICKFQTRSTDNGRRIHLRYRDESGKWTQPYACHLEGAEWRQLTRGGYRSAVELIARKTANRTDGEPDKIRQVVERIELLKAALNQS